MSEKVSHASNILGRIAQFSRPIKTLVQVLYSESFLFLFPTRRKKPWIKRLLEWSGHRSIDYGFHSYLVVSFVTNNWSQDTQKDTMNSLFHFNLETSTRKEENVNLCSSANLKHEQSQWIISYIIKRSNRTAKSNSSSISSRTNHGNEESQKQRWPCSKRWKGFYW